MIKKWPCYIKIFENEHYIFSTGMEFKTFISSLETPPNNLLLLDGSPENSKWHRNLGLEYVDQEDMQEFLKEDVYGYGDFCWVDFEKPDSLDSVTDKDLSEMLFASHTCHPLESFKFPSMKNNYLYLAHDDDYWTKIYMQDTLEYKKVIERKIISELIGRKRMMSPIPVDIIDKLYDTFINGAVLDFEEAYICSDCAGVRIYPCMTTQFNTDDIHTELDRQRKMMWSPNHLCLNYTNRTKKWSLT